MGIIEGHLKSTNPTGMSLNGFNEFDYFNDLDDDFNHINGY